MLHFRSPWYRCSRYSLAGRSHRHALAGDVQATVGAAWFGSAFNIFLLRQFFSTIRWQLSEAASIDGCSEFGIFWRIIVPLSKTGAGGGRANSPSYLSGTTSWGAGIPAKTRAVYARTGPAEFSEQAGGTSWHLLMAASVLVILPRCFCSSWHRRRSSRGSPRRELRVNRKLE